MLGIRRLLVMASVLAAGCAGPQLVHAKTGVHSTFEDLKGRAVVVTFWADWCPPCLAQMPLLEQSVARHGDQVVFLPVFVQENPDPELLLWLQDQPAWFRDQVVFANEPFLRKYDRTAMPRTYVYGKNGHLVEQFDGRVDEQRQRLLDASLLRALAANRDSQGRLVSVSR